MDFEGGAGLRQRLQRNVHPPVVGVVEHGVAMAERAALDVLAGQPDADAVGEDRRVAPAPRRLAQSTVRSSGRGEHLRPLLAHAFELAVDGEAVGQSLSSASFSSRSRSIGTAVSTFAAAPGGGGSGSGSTKSCSGCSSSIDALQLRRVLLDQRVGTSPGSSSPRSSSVRAQMLAHGRVRRDLLVHQRLRERGLVAFVVPVAPVADQVDQEVALESLAVRERQPRRLDARFGIVGVDVDDRDLEAARQPARVRGAVRVFRRRS